jgi:hypothetical protein
MTYKPSWWTEDRHARKNNMTFAPCEFKFMLCVEAIRRRDITDEQVLWLDSHVDFSSTFFSEDTPNDLEDLKYVRNRLRAIRGQEPV